MNLVGVSEIAALASVSRSAVSNWISRNPSFPKSVADLACGQIWNKEDIENWLRQNNLLTEDKMSERANMQIGAIYTHDFICKTFGGDAKGGTYLPENQQKILCGCFTKKMNPRAPECVLVGSAPRILGKAEKLANQSGPIPVFLKLETNQWEYKGQYELESFSKNPSDFEAIMNEATERDDEAVAALFFRKVDD